MKEILFRGKRIDTKEWVEGSYIYAHKWNWDGSAGHLICDIYGVNKTQVISETVGQFIGLTAKNEKMIFVGDVLRNHYGDLFLVVDEGTRVVLRTTKNKVHTWKYVHRYEIVGNIIDNPELFERSKK